jgi:hypothetical protein
MSAPMQNEQGGEGVDLLVPSVLRSVCQAVWHEGRHRWSSDLQPFVHSLQYRCSCRDRDREQRRPELEVTVQLMSTAVASVETRILHLSP